MDPDGAFDCACIIVVCWLLDKLCFWTNTWRTPADVAESSAIQLPGFLQSVPMRINVMWWNFPQVSYNHRRLKIWIWSYACKRYPVKALWLFWYCIWVNEYTVCPFEVLLICLKPVPNRGRLLCVHLWAFALLSCFSLENYCWISVWAYTPMINVLCTFFSRAFCLRDF